jgi:hypothetical protein
MKLRGPAFWIATLGIAVVIGFLLDLLSKLKELREVLTEWGVWALMEIYPGWSFVIVLGVLLFARIFLDLKDWWSAKRAPPPLRPIKIGPGTNGPDVYGMKRLFDLQLTNSSSVMLENCVVAIDSFQGRSIGGAVPVPLPLRTENQIREKRAGGFDLRPGQLKTVPLLLQDEQRRFYIPHEDGTLFQVGADHLVLSLAAYNPLHEHSHAEVVIRATPNGGGSMTFTKSRNG